MADALDIFKQQRQFINRDVAQERLDYYNSQPLAYEVPEHIARYTERKKLVLQTPHFKIPAWASIPPISGPHLEVVREGVVVTRWPVYKAPYVLIGKNAHVCDYVMEHPSCSGVHCAIVFHGEQRTFYLIDLSTNGTALNGQRIPKGQPTVLDYDATFVTGLSSRTMTLRKHAMTDTQLKRIASEGKNNNLTVANPIPPSSSQQATVAAAVPSVVPSSVSGNAVASSATNTTTATPASEVHSAAVVAPAATAEASSAAAQPPAAAAAAAAPAIVIKRHFRHLLLKHVDVSDPVSKAARNKGEAITRSHADAVELANNLRSLLVSSSVSSSVSCDEAALVEFCQQYSECKTSKKGGDLGMIEKGDMDANFDGPAFRLAPGAVSAPVTTDLGVHLIYRCAE